jgi:uncharacterized protein (TIGR03086 family)
MFRAGLAEWSRRVEGIGDHDWDRPTPDTEWTVRDLVGHLVDEHRWVAPLLDGLDLNRAGATVAALPDGEPIADWRAASQSSDAAVGAAGALDRDVDLSYGCTSARRYLAELTADLAVHAWDLGRALGEAVQLPDELAAAAFDCLSTATELSQSGYFAPSLAAGPDASRTDRLVALAGRHPAWVPGWVAG